jgi:hypothetical protein
MRTTKGSYNQVDNQDMDQDRAAKQDRLHGERTAEKDRTTFISHINTIQFKFFNVIYISAPDKIERPL